MNGFISKATILFILFSSLTYAGNVDIKNQAGCMGCHQGEATAENETMSKSSHDQGQQDQKLEDTQEVSKHTL